MVIIKFLFLKNNTNVGADNFGDGCMSIDKCWEWSYLRMEWDRIHRDQLPFNQFSSGLCNGGSLYVYHINIHWCRYRHLVLGGILTNPEILVSIVSNCLTLSCVMDGCSSIRIGSMQIRTASWNNSLTKEMWSNCIRCWKTPCCCTCILHNFVKGLHSCIVVLGNREIFLLDIFFSFSIITGFGP